MVKMEQSRVVERGIDSLREGGRDLLLGIGRGVIFLKNGRDDLLK